MSERQKIEEALEYFDEFVNTVLRLNIEEVSPIETVKNYNVIRDELAKLLVPQE